MAKANAIKAKRKCCKDRPRCKRCPVVLKRLERAGLAEARGDGRYVIDPGVKKRRLKAARAR
ncbi:MAG TPA: hypothetical protein VGP78_06840 [Solirubrobacteraceae bacterium]|nr:hypothetical protein [Solirubrobacteraceae bacterium]